MYSPHALSKEPPIVAKKVFAQCQTEQQKRNCTRTLAGSIQRTLVEDVDALHLTDELETLETGGLDVVGRDGTGLGTGGDQVLLSLDLCRPRKKSDECHGLQSGMSKQANGIRYRNWTGRGLRSTFTAPRAAEEAQLLPKNKHNGQEGPLFGVGRIIGAIGSRLVGGTNRRRKGSCPPSRPRTSSHCLLRDNLG